MTERLHFHFSLACIGEGIGNPLQCSCLENPRDRRAWWAAIYGVAQNWTQVKRLTSSSSNCDSLLVQGFSFGLRLGCCHWGPSPGLSQDPCHLLTTLFTLEGNPIQVLPPSLTQAGPVCTHHQVFNSPICAGASGLRTLHFKDVYTSLACWFRAASGPGKPPLFV